MAAAVSKKKVYAVRRGKTTGIFKTWEECKAAVNGYSCAEFKGFETIEEAKKYLLNGAVLSLEALEEAGSQRVIAYVDGSFESSIARYSFGCVIILPDGEIIRKSGSGNDPESAALRNVTGEMLGAMYAVRWCVKKGYTALDIRYDYSGIEMWATGAWKTNNLLTQKYARFMQDNAEKISISFTKIKAHTGNLYNEEADKLAKEALTKEAGIPEI